MTGHVRFVMMASLGLLASSSTFGQPISETAFTYQGELEQNGIAVSQQCDFAFSLWTGNNAPDPGVQVGPVVELSALVDEGIFTTELDFGASPLDGSARWLNIAVCCPTGCAPGYSELVPRQAITAAPYSIQTRGIFVDDSMNVGIRNSNPNAMLSVGTGDGASIQVGAAPQLQLSKDSADDKFRVQLTGSGYGGYGLQIGRDDAGHDIIFSGDITLTKDITTIDGDIGIPGVVGIGTLSPGSETSLHINAAENNYGVLVESGGAAASRIGLHASSAGFSSLAKNAYFASGQWQRFNTGGGAYLQEVEPDGDTTFNAAPPGGLVINWNRAMVIKPSGRIGMGTNNPQKHLHLNGSAIVEGTLDFGRVLMTDSCGGCTFENAFCPGNTRILSGGCERHGVPADRSYPTFNPDGWICTWDEEGPSTNTATVYAICARVE